LADSSAELEILIDHSRWLLEYHDRRGDSISQRAAALLGFVGVILALLPTALALPNQLQMSLGLWASLTASMCGLLLSAVFCVCVVSTRRVGAPAIEQAMLMLKKHTTGERVGRVRGDVAFGYLFAPAEGDVGAVQLAYAAANDRAKWFRWAVFALLGSLVALASLLTQLALQA
jgi:hypothetical protein